MKVTNSKDGVRRTNLRIEVRVGLEDLARALAFRTTRVADWREEMPFRPGRDYVLDTYRDMVRGYGTETLDYWQERVDSDDDPDEIWDWALVAAQDACPELGGI